MNTDNVRAHNRTTVPAPSPARPPRIRGSIAVAAAVAAATGGSAMLVGAAQAAPGTGVSGATDAVRVVSQGWINQETNNCSGNSYTIVNGKIVRTAPDCTSSAEGTKGTGGGGGGQGTSTPGEATNNCSGSSTTVVNGVPTTSSGCTASAKGSGG